MDKVIGWLYSAVASKTMWGAGIAVLPQIIELAKVQVWASSPQLNMQISGLISVVGGVLVAYGRTVAKGPLK